MENALKNYPQSQVAVFAVWEPILATDWSSPSTRALARLSDRRVRQYWDPNHLMAGLLKKAEESGKLHPDCCTRKGFLWDLTAAYPPGAQWSVGLPEPILLNGPVVDTITELNSALGKAK